MKQTSAQLAAERSMEAVRKKDREAWLNNFADKACVEDPVGVSPLDPPDWARGARKRSGHSGTP